MTALEVKRLCKPGIHAVGGVDGLLLRIDKAGHRRWVLRYATAERRTSAAGKPFVVRRDLGMGAYPEITLARARDLAREARDLIRQGRDPIDERKADRAARRAVPTFEAMARSLHDKLKPSFNSEKHGKDWLNSLTIHTADLLPQPVDRIDVAAVVEALNPIWSTKPETASRVRQRIEKVLDHATALGHRTGNNPAAWRGRLDAILAPSARLKKVRHHPALPWQQAPAFMQALASREGMGARALEFIILTACRSGEARGATWDEIDLTARTWTIPGDRMKAGKAHVVPLSDAAVGLLKALPRHQDCNLLFPNRSGGPISDMTVSAVCRRMNADDGMKWVDQHGAAIVPHGFRSTFRDWASESTAYPSEVVEMALAHTIANRVEAAYRRGDLLEKRRRLMQEWASFLAGAGADAGSVTAIRGVK